MKNLDNCKLVLAQIENHPETWDQKDWHCQTAHCFAGWAQILSGKRENNITVRRDARIFLGLSLREANYYFSSSRTLEELKTVLENFYNQDGFDRGGFDRHGFDQNGFDGNGFDGNGFGRDGFGRKGFNRDGFDRKGFNRDGFDRYGFDRDGLDINNKPKS